MRDAGYSRDVSSSSQAAAIASVHPLSSVAILRVGLLVLGVSYIHSLFSGIYFLDHGFAVWMVLGLVFGVVVIRTRGTVARLLSRPPAEEGACARWEALALSIYAIFTLLHSAPELLALALAPLVGAPDSFGVLPWVEASGLTVFAIILWRFAASLRPSHEMDPDTAPECVGDVGESVVSLGAAALMIPGLGGLLFNVLLRIFGPSGPSSDPVLLHVRDGRMAASAGVLLASGILLFGIRRVLVAAVLRGDGQAEFRVCDPAIVARVGGYPDRICCGSENTF